MQCFGRIFVDLAEPQQYEPHEQICCDGRRVLATNLGSMQMTMKWPKPNRVLGFSGHALHGWQLLKELPGPSTKLNLKDKAVKNKKARSTCSASGGY